MRFIICKLTKLPRVIYAHGWHVPAGQQMVYGKKNQTELVYLEKGVLSRTAMNGEIRTFRAGTMFCASEGASMFACGETDCLLFSAAVETDENVMIEGSPDDVLRRMVLETRDEGSMCVMLPAELYGKTASEYAEELRRLSALRLGLSPLAPLRAAQRMFDILVRLTMYSLTVTEPEHNEQNEQTGRVLNEAVEYINTHLYERIPVTALARAVNISTSQLTRIFKSTLHETPRGYINRVKMQRVRELLAHLDITPEEAGRSVCFENAQYFARLFRKFYGQSPYRYQRAQRRAGFTADEKAESAMPLTLPE